MSHTPGPWHVVFDYTGQLNPVELTATVYEDEKLPFRGDVCRLQSCVHISGIGHEELRANASLIAAAPDMLQALKELFDAANHFNVDYAWFTDNDHNREILMNAEAAIAKAEGRLK